MSEVVREQYMMPELVMASKARLRLGAARAARALIQ